MITEEDLENQCLEWFEGLGYQTLHGSKIEPTGSNPERKTLQDVVLEQRIRDSIKRINPHLPEVAINDSIQKLLAYTANIYTSNHVFHRLLIEGIKVEYQVDGVSKGDQVKLIDFKDASKNDWLVVQQFSVDGVSNGEKDNRRPDVVVFLNGLPISVLELKNPSNEDTDIWAAYNQIQTYKKAIKDLFVFNEALIISDGVNARIGSLTADKDRFMPWRTIDGSRDDTEDTLELEVMIKGFFNKELLLDYLQYFIGFEINGSKVVKKQAGYHQFHGVRAAVENTIKATSKTGDGRCGVFWHTQGSGKSFSMVCYAAKLMAAMEMENPTLVIVTDRNDLDDQLFETFMINEELLRQKPIQAEGRDDLQQKLASRPTGGIFFTTMQKFKPEKGQTRYPTLSERHNIVVMADEAHRSQYGTKAKVDQKTGQMKYGYAQHMRDALPNAGYIGFTGTPVELEDRDTRAVFGDYITIYDIEQAQRDNATKPLYYESRLIKLDIAHQISDEDLDDEADDLIANYDEDDQNKMKSRHAALEALVSAESRVDKLARDLIEHFETREEVMLSKAMIVCISREACVQLYNKIVELKPEWHDEDPQKGVIKVIMTGTSSDQEHLQRHIYKKPVQRKIAARLKDPSSDMKMVIVCDMWLTGFDAPCLNTMYIDKPLKGHNLMQAIARVNRVFRDKEGGLIVDYLGIAPELREALRIYTDNKGKGSPTVDLNAAMNVLLDKLSVIRGIMHGFDYDGFETNTLKLLAGAMNHILKQNDGKKRFDKAALALVKAYSLCSTHPDAGAYKEEIAFFETVRAAIKKSTTAKVKMTDDKVQNALRQVVSKSLVTGEIVDVFKSAGLNKPEISILDDEFLEDVKKLKQENLAVELLRKLIEDEIYTRTAKNAMAHKSFSELLKRSIGKYKNRSVETSQVIAELIKIAKELKASADRGEDIGLSKEELAFYDALLLNESAAEILENDAIVLIARELAKEIRNSAQPDWTNRQNLKAKMRRNIKNILRRTGYPPDEQEGAVERVLEQAELMAT